MPTPSQEEVLALRSALTAPFPEGSVRFVPAVLRGSKALAVPYLTAKSVMDRLDDVLGLDGWRDSYRVLSCGAVVCQLEVRLGSAWVSRSDVGAAPSSGDPGDKMKDAFSDALKRAAAKFGVGRYLKSFAKAWCDYDTEKGRFLSVPRLQVAREVEEGTHAGHTTEEETTPQHAAPSETARFCAGVQEFAASLDADGLLSAESFWVWARAWSLGKGETRGWAFLSEDLRNEFRRACKKLKADQISAKIQGAGSEGVK